MKKLLLLGLLAAPLASTAGPPSPRVFVGPLMRQDLTGQGAFHRLGLFREQEQAIAAAKKAEARIKKIRKKPSATASP
jgi:hypothetical protein